MHRLVTLPHVRISCRENEVLLGAMALPLESLIPISTSIFILAAWIVNHYASPGVPFLIKLLVTISLWLGFGGIALLPIDLQITTVYKEEEEGDKSQPNETYTAWITVYLSTMVLGFVALPLVREALKSGQFTISTMARAGCRNAIKKYLFMLIIGVLAIIALTIKLHDWHIVPVVMAIGNTYGLLLVSLFLGYGLVDVPRHAYAKADAHTELRSRRILAGNADEALFDAVWELQVRGTFIICCKHIILSVGFSFF